MENTQDASVAPKAGNRSRRRRRLIVWAVVALLAPPAGLGLWCLGLRVTGNFHVVVPGKVYRSAQPSADELRKWTGEYGLKTVINLRGGRGEPLNEAEKDLLESEGVRFVYVRLKKSCLPPAKRLRALMEALETAPRPILLHCRAGSDRTGLASVMAAMAIGGQDYRTARRQMSVRYGHVDCRSSTVRGILDRYETYCESNGQDPGGWAEFRRWAMTIYQDQDKHANEQP